MPDVELGTAQGTAAEGHRLQVGPARQQDRPRRADPVLAPWGASPESVIQYSIAVDLDLYRLNGVIPEKQLSKYEPVIMHMIQSFQSKASPAASKPAP